MLTDRALEERDNKKSEIKDIQYGQLEETQQVDLVNGFVTFTKHFKYLDSYISYNLIDYFDIEYRSVSATNAMVDIKNFWDNTHVDIYGKYLILPSILKNILLWLCEAWLLHTTLKNKLESFLQRHSIRIMRIYLSSKYSIEILQYSKR